MCAKAANCLPCDTIFCAKTLQTREVQETHVKRWWITFPALVHTRGNPCHVCKKKSCSFDVDRESLPSCVPFLLVTQLTSLRHHEKVYTRASLDGILHGRFTFNTGIYYIISDEQYDSLGFPCCNLVN